MHRYILSKQDIKEIEWLYYEYEERIQNIANKFRVNHATIYYHLGKTKAGRNLKRIYRRRYAEENRIKDNMFCKKEEIIFRECMEIIEEAGDYYLENNNWE